MPKRTPKNCSLIKRGERLLIGRPEIRNGKCLGYGGCEDEPCEDCQRCVYCESYCEED